MMKPLLTVPIIGHLRSPLREKFGTPRQPNLVQVSAYIEFLPPYDDARAFDGLAEFSHVWLLWQFHRNNDQIFRPHIRPPRLGGNQKIGVFASRSMYRPAPIGLSVVKIEQIVLNKGKVTLFVRGADLIDGTPIVDIKPYIAYADAIVDATSGFAPTPPPQLPVCWQAKARETRQRLMAAGLLDAAQVLDIEQLLAQDPRPAYQDDQREYGMAYDRFNIRFCVINRVIQLQDVECT